MDATRDLRILLASRYPLVLAEVGDERRFLEIMRGAATELGLPVWTWSVTSGLARDGAGPQYGTAQAVRALDFVHQTRTPGVFVFADAHAVLEDPVVLRRVKEVAQAAQEGQTIVLTAPRRVAPEELRGLAVPWALTPPTAEEIERLVVRAVENLAARGVRTSLGRDELAAIGDALQGLSLGEAERLLEQAAVRDGRLDAADVAFIRREKIERLDSGGVLELVEADLGTLEDVGGMDSLKRWLALRARALGRDGAAFGLEPPRGVLIMGVPGCGKSMVAKALARSWNLPLVLLDPGRLYGKYVGESEERLSDTLSAVEAMAPVVLWIDEIEKGFAAGGEGDTGVSRRLLGTFLRWLQERRAGVFLAATCNDVRALPPELLRKGRFDETFFVDLPAGEERAAIFRVHLARRGRDPAAFDGNTLVGASDGFTGAEIEAAVVAALYRVFDQGRDLTTADIVAELAGTAPLSRSRAEDVARLRDWAAGRAVPAS